MKQVILITGTPCVGKTTLAKQLANNISALYVNLTDYAKQNNLTLGEDTERNTTIVDEEKMQQALTTIINKSDTSVVIDGHFAASVVPSSLSTHVFVLRRSPIELKEFMQKAGFSEAKMNENLSAEILDVCLVEALEKQEGKVCELDITGKTVEETLTEVTAILRGDKKCFCGFVDWLGMLEREGLTDQYLKD